MNDRYLCRAKRKSDKKWIYGNLIQTDDGVYIIQNYVPQHLIGKYEVDPSTICQCTAVPDRDKKIMYENDVVRASGGVRGIIRFGRYGVEKNDYGFYVEWEKSQPYWRNDIYYWKSELRVIGSYIDNPELLEV